MNERKEPGTLTDEEQFARQAKKLFDDSVERLDGQTLSRLNRGRQAALAELGQRPRITARQWAPAAGVAAAAVFSVVLWNGDSAVVPVTPPAEVTDFELLLAEDSFEMLEELEFYAWIEFDAEDENGDDKDGNVG